MSMNMAELLKQIDDQLGIQEVTMKCGIFNKKELAFNKGFTIGLMFVKTRIESSYKE